MKNLIKIATFNVNSINIRLEYILSILKKHNLDFLCLQELKCEAEKINHEIFNQNGFYILTNCQKAYNGSAIIISSKIYELIKDNIKIKYYFSEKLIHEARYIEIEFSLFEKNFLISSIYAPNGSSIDSEKFIFKKLFFEEFYNYLGFIKNTKKDFLTIFCGDFNICPQKNDLYNFHEMKDSVSFSLCERSLIRNIINLGFYDVYRILNPNKIEYSWFDYRNNSFSKNHGMRIDYILMNSNTINFLHKCYFDDSWRSMERPSDHIPFFSELYF